MNKNKKKTKNADRAIELSNFFDNTNDKIKNEQSSIQIILDYSGKATENHSMDIKDFTNSLNGFYDLLKLVSNKYGFIDEEIKIEIKDVKDGSLMAIINFYLEHKELIGDMANIFEVGGVIYFVYEKFINYLKNKKQISNIKDLNSIKVIENLESNSILDDINSHKNTNIFTECLEKGIDIIEIKTDNKKIESLNLSKNDRKNLAFIPENKELKSEIIEEKNMILFLDGLRGSSTKWPFFKLKDEKKEKITATVLSEFLLEFAKDNIYNDYSNIKLYCKIKIKSFIKEGGKNYSTEYYIISCSLEKTNDFYLN